MDISQVTSAGVSTPNTPVGKTPSFTDSITVNLSPSYSTPISHGIKRAPSQSPEHQTPSQKQRSTTNVVIDGAASSDMYPLTLPPPDSPLPDNLDLILSKAMPAVHAALVPFIKACAAEEVSRELAPIRKILDEQRRTIEEQRAMINRINDRFEITDRHVYDLREGMWYLGRDHNELNQYGRRNSIRIDNVPIEDPKNVDNDAVVVKVLNDNLGTNITSDDIERSHPLTKVEQGDNNFFICKFKTYKCRASVINKKKKLHEDKSRIYVKEDLTKWNYHLFRKLQLARKDHLIYSAWTYDGKVYMRKRKDGQKFQVRTMDQLRYLVEEYQEGPQVRQNNQVLPEEDDPDQTNDVPPPTSPDVSVKETHDGDPESDTERNVIACYIIDPPGCVPLDTPNNDVDAVRDNNDSASDDNQPPTRKRKGRPAKTLPSITKKVKGSKKSIIKRTTSLCGKKRYKKSIEVNDGEKSKFKLKLARKTVTKGKLKTELTDGADNDVDFVKPRRKYKKRTDNEPLTIHQCEECEYSTKLLGNLQRHRYRHMDGKKRPFKCYFCNFTASQSSDLKIHTKRHTGTGLIHCTVGDCRYICSRASDLKVHKRTHEHEDYVYCSTCDYSSVRPSDLRRHMKTHETLESAKTIMCSQCPYMTNQQAYLTNHIRNAHGDNEGRMFKCPECPYEAKQECNLASHLKVHSDERPFLCPDCGFAFKRKSELKQHVEYVHMGVKDFLCTHCSYTTGRAKNLKKHMLTHTSERLFACTQCPFKAKDKQYLQAHVKTVHTIGRNFLCNQCDFAGKRQQDLSDHLISHTDARPYACTECEYSGKRPIGLRRHMLQIHGFVYPGKTRQIIYERDIKENKSDRPTAGQVVGSDVGTKVQHPVTQIENKDTSSNQLQNVFNDFYSKFKDVTDKAISYFYDANPESAHDIINTDNVSIKTDKSCVDTNNDVTDVDASNYVTETDVPNIDTTSIKSEEHSEEYDQDTDVDDHYGDDDNGLYVTDDDSITDDFNETYDPTLDHMLNCHDPSHNLGPTEDDMDTSVESDDQRENGESNLYIDDGVNSITNATDRFELVDKESVKSIDPDSGIIQCMACVYNTDDMAEFNEHVLMNHQDKNSDETDDIKPLVIAKKSTETKNEKRVKMQSRKRNDEHKFVCPECDLRCGKVYNLKRHVKRAHLDSSDAIILKIQQQYCRQQDPNSEEIPLTCPTCNYSSTKLYNMKRHLTKHRDKTNDDENVSKTPKIPRVNKNNTMCSICGKCFDCQSALKIHLMKHSGEKPFQCDECNYSSSRLADLNKHKKRHSGEQSYLCPHCPYRGVDMSAYSQHIKKHSDVKPFLCPFCDYSCKFRQSLTSHVTRRHNTI